MEYRLEWIEWHLIPQNEGDLLCWAVVAVALFASFYFRRKSPSDSKGWLLTAIVFAVWAGLGYTPQ